MITHSRETYQPTTIMRCGFMLVENGISQFIDSDDLILNILNSFG